MREQSQNPDQLCNPTCKCVRCVSLRQSWELDGRGDENVLGPEMERDGPHPVETCQCKKCRTAMQAMLFDREQRRLIAMEAANVTHHVLDCACSICQGLRLSRRLNQGGRPQIRETVYVPPPADVLDDILPVKVAEHQFSLANLREGRFQLEVSVGPVYGRPKDGWAVCVKYLLGKFPPPIQDVRPAWIVVMTPPVDGATIEGFWKLVYGLGRPGLAPLHGSEPTRPDPCWEQELWDMIALAVMEKTGWHPNRHRGLEPLDGPVVTPVGVTLQRLVSTSLRAQELACLLRQCEDFLKQRVGVEANLLAQKIHNTLLTF